MASEAIPTAPPPPPPPLLNNDNTNTTTFPNGPTTSQVQSSDNGGQTMSSDGAKSWERAWTVDEMRKGATNWSLASDAGVTIFIIRICRIGIFFPEAAMLLILSVNAGSMHMSCRNN